MYADGAVDASASLALDVLPALGLRVKSLLICEPTREPAPRQQLGRSSIYSFLNTDVQRLCYLACGGWLALSLVAQTALSPSFTTPTWADLMGVCHDIGPLNCRLGSARPSTFCAREVRTCSRRYLPSHRHVVEAAAHGGAGERGEFDDVGGDGGCKSEIVVGGACVRGCLVSRWTWY